MNDWIVITGSLTDSTSGGGFEFFGPFADEQNRMDCSRTPSAFKIG